MDASHCAYRSKPCYNARALKKGGSLHRFCAFHRDRANDSQRRWQERRRRNDRMSQSYDSENSDESDASSRKRRRVNASPNDALTAPTRLDMWVPIESKMTWAFDATCPPIVPLVPGTDKALTDDDLVLLEAFMSERDDLPVHGMRYTPESTLAQTFEDSFLLRL